VAMRSAMLPVRPEAQRRSFPIVALTAVTVLLKYRQWDVAWAWLSNIPDFVPDAAVLRAELTLRTGATDSAYMEALGYFLRLSDNFLPSLAEASAYALQQAETFRMDESLSEKERLLIQVLHARLVKALGVFRAGGLFASFAGPAERISPALLNREATPVPEVIEEEAKKDESTERGMSAGAGT
jgi:hypothetical protein